MANLEINTQLFDGLDLHQRIQAILETQFQLNAAAERRMDKGSDYGESCVTNGQFVAFYVIEEALKAVQDYLIDSTVEKLGGGE